MPFNDDTAKSLTWTSKKLLPSAGDWNPYLPLDFNTQMRLAVVAVGMKKKIEETNSFLI